MQTHSRSLFFLTVCCLWLICFMPSVARAADADTSGVVVDSAGQPQAEIPLVLRVLVTDEEGHRHWKEQAQTVTDQAGNYSFTNITAAATCLPPTPPCLSGQAETISPPQPNHWIAPNAKAQPNNDLFGQPGATAVHEFERGINRGRAVAQDATTIDRTAVRIYQVDLAPAASHTSLDLRILKTATALQSAQAAAQGEINGTVLGDDNLPASNIAVSLYSITRYPDYTMRQLVRRTLTNDTGQYNFRNLSPGEYQVGFADVLLPERYVAEYYADVSDIYEAKVIVVNEDSTTINATLARAGQITGTVRDPNGQPAAQIAISLSRWNEEYGYYESFNSASPTTVDGYYEFGGLPAGRYRLSYGDTRWPNRFMPHYYANTGHWDEAVDIELASGEIHRAVDVLLTVGGKVQGKVTDQAGEPLANIYVNLYYHQYFAENDEWYWNHIQSSFTDEEGTYEVTALPTGTYLVEFTDYSWPPRYQPEFYEDATSWETATQINIQAGSTTAQINAQLAATSRVQGQITLANGQAVGNATALLFQQGSDGNWNAQSSGWTDANGFYEINGVTTGRYRVGFIFPNGSWPKLFYGQAVRVEAATDVDVSPGATVTGIDGVFAIPGAISGQVFDSSGTALEGIGVTVLFSAIYNGDQVGWFEGTTTSTNDAGQYTIPYLLPDEYLVRFWDTRWENRQYSTLYYGGAVEPTTATRVRVNANALTSGIDGQLVGTGTIRGQITTDAQNSPVANVTVEAYQRTADYAGNLYWNYINSTSTDAQGQYTLQKLNVGEYRLVFIDYERPHRFVIEYYNNAFEFEAAQTIVVDADTEVTGINAQLGLGSQISGRITDADGMAIANVGSLDIQLYRAQLDDTGETIWPYYYFGYPQIAANGSYSITLLPAGRYRLRVVDWSNQHQPTYYVNATTLESATDIVVDGETDVTDINVQLLAKEPVTPTVGTLPVAHNDLISVTVATTLTQQVSVTGSVLDNDRAFDANNTLTAELVTNALFGTVELQPTGRFSYTPTGPTANVPGVDSFVYRLSTGDGESTTAVVFLLLPDGNRIGAQRILLPLLAAQ